MGVAAYRLDMNAPPSPWSAGATSPLRKGCQFRGSRVNVPAAEGQGSRGVSDPVVQASTTHRQGRFVMTAGGAPFVADQAAKHGGPGQAPGAAELFLASLLSCAFGIIQRTGRERGTPPARIEAEASYTLHPEDRTRFSVIRMEFGFAGIEVADADALVAAFVAQCPIYNTAARTTPTDITTTIL